MATKLDFKRVLQQLKNDLIGKDSHRGVTLTYAWLANQFGHIALGFIPSFLTYHFFNISALRAAIVVSIFWLLFEMYNFLAPLLTKKKDSFQPKWKNIAFDTFTDVCYFVLGAFLFSLIMSKENTIILLVLIPVMVYLSFASIYWYKIKMYQFYARYPFQFRLSQWDFEIDAKDTTTIDEFISVSQEKGSCHLLIFGGLNTGKTSLGVGILNELSIKKNSCLYVGAMKLYNYFFEDDIVTIDIHKIWDWKTADFLMIDDINPSDPIKEEIITPEIFLNFIDTFEKENSRNRSILSQKNVVWVLGNEDQLNNSFCNRWRKIIQEIGVESNCLFEVNLKKIKE